MNGVADQPGFPGGSKSRVNRAGDAIRDGRETAEDLLIVEEWRAAHRAVLNTFQAILRTRTRGTRISVAQRHKRKKTIFDKLRRHPKMALSRMDDVAGCRLIFPNIKALHSFRQEFLRARFNHKRRNAPEKYDYMTTPKVTGYRGIHDVYSYDVKSLTGKRYEGLFVEIQYRTLVQHSWATAVEVIGFVTESQPKFQAGDRRYEDAMALASEILARAHEDMKGPLPTLTNEQLVKDFLTADKELGLLQMLRGLNAVDQTISDNRNAILIFNQNQPLEIKSFRDATDALRALFDLEKQYPGQDIVLVKAASTDEMRLAFKNYFTDARDFIARIEEGCTALSGRGGADALKRLKRKNSRRA